jgi:hypothetical protein
MGTDLARRLRRVSAECLHSEACDLMLKAADAIETLTQDLTAAIQHRERLMDAMKKAQVELRALQDSVVTPQDGQP